MSNREKAKELIDLIPEAKLTYLIGFIQGLTLADDIYSNPFKPETKAEFLESLDRGIEQANMGNYQDAHESLVDIRKELCIWLATE